MSVGETEAELTLACFFLEDNTHKDLNESW